MLRTATLFLALFILQAAAIMLSPADAAVRCEVKKVDGTKMLPVTGKPRYFQSRPANCDAGSHVTGGGFRREFSNKANRKWRIDASFPVSTNGLLETWACWARYIGPKPIPAKAPSTFFCYSVCCPD
jgi:hypothetical protein